MRQYKVEKEFDYKGYKCVVIGQEIGHRCGYIGVDKNNKCYGKDYDELYGIDVHGGLTYAGETYENYPCEDKLWWFGFDCAHLGDGKDFDLIKELADKDYYDYETRVQSMFSHLNNGEIRSVDYCISECKKVVDQLIELNKDSSLK